jgi:hypothetical protein
MWSEARAIGDELYEDAGIRKNHCRDSHGIAANEPVSAFDHNGNRRVDVAVVVWLFSHL